MKNSEKENGNVKRKIYPIYITEENSYPYANAPDVVQMEFCPRCGTRLIHRPRSKELFYCPKCRYKSDLHKGDHPASLLSVAKFSDPSIAILDRDKLNLRTLPTVNAYCQKCGGNKAETWTLTVGSEGTMSVTFYRCVSCGFTWRETDWRTSHGGQTAAYPLAVLREEI